MKRVFLAIPLFILPLFAACGEIAGQDVPPSMGTAVAETQTAAVWTPTPIPTVDPNKLKILEWLNAGFQREDLETMFDAQYTAVSTDFPYVPGSSYRAFHLEILCDCAVNSNCCVAEHMFVMTIQSMKAKADKFIGEIPPDVIRVEVVCFNRSGRIGAVSVAWSDARDYLSGIIDGNTFAWRVIHNAAP